MTVWRNGNSHCISNNSLDLFSIVDNLCENFKQAQPSTKQFYVLASTAEKYLHVTQKGIYQGYHYNFIFNSRVMEMT